MTDVLTSAQRSYNMSRIRARGNATTELVLARAFRVARVHGWRRHAPLPGRPDFVFRAARIAVFVHGCFWHGCPRCYRAPIENRAYWRAKVEGNRGRDRRVARDLRACGWRVLKVWEHSLSSSTGVRRQLLRIQRALSRARQEASSHDTR